MKDSLKKEIKASQQEIAALYVVYDCETLLRYVIPRQNGTPSQVEALKKSIERGKGL